MSLFTRILAAPVRALVWTLDLCDANGDPSLSKSIAFGVAFVALRDAWIGHFSVLNVSALALATSAAFGRSVFMNWLQRNQWNTSHAITGDAAQIIKATTEAIAARRDRDRGIEPS